MPPPPFPLTFLILLVILSIILPSLLSQRLSPGAGSVGRSGRRRAEELMDGTYQPEENFLTRRRSSRIQDLDSFYSFRSSRFSTETAGGASLRMARTPSLMRRDRYIDNAPDYDDDNNNNNVDNNFSSIYTRTPAKNAESNMHANNRSFNNNPTNSNIPLINSNRSRSNNQDNNDDIPDPNDKYNTPTTISYWTPPTFWGRHSPVSNPNNRETGSSHHDKLKNSNNNNNSDDGNEDDGDFYPPTPPPSPSSPDMNTNRQNRDNTSVYRDHNG